MIEGRLNGKREKGRKGNGMLDGVRKQWVWKRNAMNQRSWMDTVTDTQLWHQTRKLGQVLTPQCSHSCAALSVTIMTSSPKHKNRCIQSLDVFKIIVLYSSMPNLNSISLGGLGGQVASSLSLGDMSGLSLA